MADPAQNAAVRTEVEKGTNIGVYDAAMRTEAEKEEAAGPGFPYHAIKRTRNQMRVMLTL